MADTTGVHSLGPHDLAERRAPEADEGGDVRAGITADQIAAQRLGQGTHAARRSSSPPKTTPT